MVHLIKYINHHFLKRNNMDTKYYTITALNKAIKNHTLYHGYYWEEEVK